MQKKRPPLDFDAIKQAAVGCYVSKIFPSVGIQLMSPANKHQPCPLCGGTDRFRCDDKLGEGTWICNQCGAGNGFTLVKNYTNSDVYETNALIAAALGIDGTQQVSEAQRQAWRKEQEEREAREREAKRAKRLEVAQVAQNIWQTAQPSNDSHPYLVKKGVTGFGLRQNADGSLLVPMYYFNKATGKITLVNIQTITKDGDKLFLKDGLVSGAYFAIGGGDTFQTSNIIFICEGYATGATIFDALGYAHPIVIAFNAGNLLHVAPSIRAQYPNHRIIICADDDTASAIKRRDDDVAKGKEPKALIEYNDGLYKSQKAAAAIGGEVVWPEFESIDSEVVA